jgi:protein-L-isoaspartate O-methyltransferase
VYLRRLPHKPPSGNEVATRTEALAILTRLARDLDPVSGERMLEIGPGTGYGSGISPRS